MHVLKKTCSHRVLDLVLFHYGLIDPVPERSKLCPDNRCAMLSEELIAADAIAKFISASTTTKSPAQDSTRSHKAAQEFLARPLPLPQERVVARTAARWSGRRPSRLSVMAG
jgi:hypothetical protein